MKIAYATAIAALASLLIASETVAAESGDAAKGRRVFGACAACHSLRPGRDMTGPSLAGLWNRKAGSVATFRRYSPALKSADIVWNDRTLDAWIKDPQQVVPGNQMTFRGIKDAQQRADLLAFLKQATQPGAASSRAAKDSGGGMMGMQGNAVPNLKQLGPSDRVRTITYCEDTYAVTTADGRTRKFWERNLRLMTDSSARGPSNNAPVLLPAGMLGDRADAIFASPAEISAFIAAKC